MLTQQTSKKPPSRPIVHCVAITTLHDILRIEILSIIRPLLGLWMLDVECCVKYFLQSGELSWCGVQQCQEENKSRLCEALKLSVEALKLTMFITFLDNYSPPDNGSVEQRSSLGQIQGDTEAACGGGDLGGRSGQQ